MAYQYNDLMPSNIIPMAPGQDGSWAMSALESQPVQDILWTLGLLDRPRNAIASAVAGKGFVPGLLGDVQTSWGDLVGIPETSERDSWAEYLGKGGARLALDFVGDPLLPFFGVGKLAKAAGLAKEVAPGRTLSAVGRVADKLGSERALEAFQGTKIGGMLTHTLAGDKGRRTMEILDEVQRKGSVVPLRQMAADISKKIDDVLKAEGIQDIPAYRANEAFEGVERLGLNPLVEQKIRPIIQPLLDFNEGQFDEHQLLKALFNLPTSEKIIEKGAQRMPRVGEPIDRWLNPGPQADTRRKIFRWYPTAERIGEPLTLGEVGRLSGIAEHEGRYFWDAPEEVLRRMWRETRNVADLPDLERGIEVFPGMASKAEAKRIAPYRHWKEDLVEAPLSEGLTRQGKINYLELIRRLQTEGIAQNKDWLGGPLPKDMKALDVRGLEHIAVPKHIARWLENKAGSIFTPDTAQGAIENFFRNTKPGQMASAFQNTWKRNVLAMFPGFWIGNLSTNAAMALTGEPAAIRELGSMAKVMRENPSEALRGLTGQQLRDEYRLRGLTDTGYLHELGDASQVATGDVSKIPFMDMATGRLGLPGKGINWASKEWSKANDLMFKYGQKGTEEPFRVMLANSWIRKNVPEGMVPTPEHIDAAVRFAKRRLFSAEDMTRAERTAAHFMPFVSWARNITGQTLEDVAVRPQRLAALGRGYDTAFMPYGDKEGLPEWQREQGPTAGAFGHRWQTSSGDPGAFLTGRFTPQGTIEQLVSRPTDFALGMLGPLAKIPLEGLGNWSYFKHRPIDELAGGWMQALAAPLTGGPYSTAPQSMLGARLPAMYDYALTNWTPAGRYLRSLDTLTGNVLFEDPNQLPMSPGERVRWWLTGGKLYPVDEAKNAYYQQTAGRREDAAVKALINRSMKRGDFEGYEHYMNQLEKVRDRRMKDLTPIPFR